MHSKQGGVRKVRYASVVGARCATLSVCTSVMNGACKASMHSRESYSCVLIRVRPWLRCIGLWHVDKYLLATRSCKRMIAKARSYLRTVLFGYCERSRRGF